jgi:hypothetical protein
MSMKTTVLGFLFLLSGCVTMPVGPSVLVLPGTGKPFEQFQDDNEVCQNWAAQQTGTSPQPAAENRAAAGAVIGTLVGAGAGAAIGAATGNPGAGAAIGAGSGLLLGTAYGADAGRGWYYEIQRRYDNAFLQCMYAKGNQVPMSAPPSGASFDTSPPPSSYSAPPRTDGSIPPPPPGPPPPPPPS